MRQQRAGSHPGAAVSTHYADRLRDEAGEAEAQIEKLSQIREAWGRLRAVDDCPPELADYAGEQMDKLADQIGELQRRVDDLDDDIHAEDPER